MADSSHQRQDVPGVLEYNAPLRDGRLPPVITMDLSEGFHRLSLATASVTSLPASSPTLSPAASSRTPSQSRHVSSATPMLSQTPALRKTPSSTSLRDERRLSTPSLQKRLSSSSLRSVSLSHGMNDPSGGPRPSLSRRSSSNFLNFPAASMFSPRVPLETPVEVAAPTASSIGAEHFEKEVQLHQSVDLQSKTLVVIQDACYGHRFSRPRTSKAALGTIVERPERLRASILGLSTAYVRVGKRHAGGSFAPHPDLDVDLLPPPPFQIRKSAREMPLTSPAVTHVHGAKWMDDLKVMCDAAESRLALNGKELVRPRSAGRDNSTYTFHEGDLYLCSKSLHAFQGALGGVCDAIDAVFSNSAARRAFVCIRPPGHHCSSGHPSGFCWLNNVHVGIAHAAMTHGLTHAAILDFDLHHGDGSQAIAWQQNTRAISAARNAAPYKKTAIGYYSLHDINSYPCEMGDEEKVRNASICIDNAHGQSIWNVHLEPWKNHEEFWQLYNNKYSILFEKARKFLRFHTERLRNVPGSPIPKAAIFISAGFDASEWEGAGMQRHKVNVPTDFYARFTADVVHLAEEEGLGTDGRIISLLEGGYSDRALVSGVLSHLSGLADTPTAIQEQNGNHQSRLASEMMERLGWNHSVGDRVFKAPELTATVVFDTEWWAPALLDELETLAYPPPPPPSKKPQKSGPSFFAPTQSSVAKKVVPTKERRSIGSPGGDFFVPPSLPEVDWATAAHELWKVLIPSDRQTMSCRPEELNAEASRTRRERFVTTEPPATPSSTEEKRMQLRQRKPKTSVLGTPKALTPRRPSSRSSRRTTIGSVSDLPDPTLEAQQRRRQSATSSVVSDAGDTSANSGRRTPTRASTRAAVSPNPSGAVPVRKRAPGGSRSGTPKRSSSPRKTPSVPRVPSLYLSSGHVGSYNGADRQCSMSSNDDREDKDVDSLATGVRKLNIKLNVPPPEENAMREKKPAEERRRTSGEKKKPAAKIPRKSATPKPTRAIAPKPAKVSAILPKVNRQISQPIISDRPSEIKTEASEIKVDIPSLTSSLIEEERPLSPSMSAAGISPMNTTYQGEFPAAIPKKAPQPGSAMSPPLTPGFAPTAMHPQITIQSPALSVAPARENLPVFTSTSQIPFAPVAPYAGYQPAYQVQHAIVCDNHASLALQQQSQDEINERTADTLYWSN